jgi:LCP family protein required for cell wall assembly
MRIPSWLVVIFSLGSFFVLTTLCSFVSYSFVRTAVIDASDQGVQIPSVVEFVEYMINPPDAENVFGINIAEVSTSTPIPRFELQPTATPDPSAMQPTQPPVTDQTATDEAPTDEPTPSNMISLTDFLSGNTTEETTDDPSSEPTTDEPAGLSAEEQAIIDDLPAWQDLDRINILLMGTDERGDEQFEDRFRTDTMIVVQIDPIRKTMGVLSFPRDLWVRVPGFAQPNKITFANYLGDGSDLPGGGPALAMETIRENFGIRVDYFVQINFDVFLKVVDLIAPNGVELCVNEHILDTKYPDAGRGTITVEFNIGCQLVNAERLLQYARTRATYGGDFDRNRRQQEVLNALQKQLLSADGLGSMVASIPSVYNELAGSYRTDLDVRQLMALAGLVLQVPNENITYGQIGALQVEQGKTTDGLDILIPNNIAISRVIAETFDPQPNLSIGELRTLATQENASITILNNTDITGLAGRVQEWLTSQGIRVDSVGNVPEAAFDSSTTLILDYRGKTNSLRLLRDVMGLPVSAVRVGAGSQIQSSADIVILVGSDITQIIGE